ncbi:LysR family transcriptional regulator [Paracoccus aurantiacus]|uniref:LysR family transcriptional regulator n=1 Tax=Paracoccus aurantiacus TaxID=2599412 RepID=A0A5C6S782_9RHOB|nr:LysR substrate-binding domain-containing protein [Paracoccus aurantiacus]TXB70361.1 LysR family transcriptional regulator [Paracoccus aurantiacus]
MDTTWLDDLQALAKTLNFSRAAEARNITQPAFGRRIRALETWCGATLIDRSTHRLSLTPAGRIMMDAAGDVGQRLDRARREIAQAQTATATLTFAATHALSFRFFPGWMQGLGTEMAALPVRLLSDNMKECERVLLSGDAQFLLCHHHPASPTALPEADFRHIVLSHDRLVPVSLRDGAKPRFALPGTRDAPVPALRYETGSGMGRILDAVLFAKTGELHLAPVLTSHLAMVLHALAIEGRGVAWVPESLAAPELRDDGRLVLAGGAEWSVAVEIGLFRPRSRLPDMAERFWQQARRA